jgi:hypothetical protein
MPYTDREHKTSNVNYLNKDFSSLKNTLMGYAKTYFPNTYKDFNETSPGMMLIEMSAYVGDVLSYYIDQQYKEMMLPLAEERRNVINIAKMLGYKTKAVNPAYTDLKFTQTVGTTGIEPIVPNYAALSAGTRRISPRTQVTSISNTDIIFETLDYVDFTVSSSADIEPVATGWDDSTGLVNEFTITRNIKAISGNSQKSKTFTIGSPTKFLKLTIPQTNVIEIMSVVDSNSNTWYEVDYLSQDMVPKEIFRLTSTDSDAYQLADDSVNVDVVPVPYSLEYTKTSKRFITEVNDDDTTSLIFGNGILRSGQLIQNEYFQTEQAGLTIPGEPSDFGAALNPLIGDDKATLGETPANTTLTVTYRIGGGLSANVPVGDLTTISGLTNVSVTNTIPARGGSSGDTIEEIRHKANAHFASQNRCVTKADYEARVLSMPAKFGNIAKVYVDRTSTEQIFDVAAALGGTGAPDTDTLMTYDEFLATMGAGTLATQGDFPTIDIYTLSYDNNKNLVNVNNSSQLLINLKKYIDRHRIITDEIAIKKGYIVNFGVIFDVVSQRSANKSDVKLKCINKIINYFSIDKMQFRQPIYVSDLEYELMGIDGVRAVNHVTLTQDKDYDGDGTDEFENPLYNYIVNPTDTTLNFVSQDINSGYGHQYDFSGANQGGMILPSVTPSVFELKNPNQNVKGVVR